MDAGAQSLAAAIGERVKQQRRALDLTLEGLAGRAGISRRMLVSVEQGAANPSVGTLLRLSEALGVGLPELVEPPTSSAVKITRAGDGAALWTGEHGGKGVLVSSTETPDVLELWDWTLAPGERHDSEPHGSGNRELLHLIVGQLLVESGDDRYELSAGDAITFAGDTVHAYENQSEHPARFALTVFEPGVAVARKTGDEQ